MAWKIAQNVLSEKNRLVNTFTGFFSLIFGVTGYRKKG